MNGPHWIKQWIADLAMLNDQFRNDDGSVDFDALGREEYMFRMALITRNFSKSERALVVFEKAQASYETNVERGKKGGRPRKDNTADGDIREDSQDCKSRTSANFYGDAAIREEAEVIACRESGAVSPTTISKNIGNGQGTEAPLSQGRAGADSVRWIPLHSAPARSSARRFSNKQDFMCWAIDAGLDPIDAGECWDATIERGGKDADGNRVNNMQAYAKQWCRTRAKNRSIA